MDNLPLQRAWMPSTRKLRHPWHQHHNLHQKMDIPADKRKEVTHGRIVVGYKPDKLEKRRSCLTVEGNQIVCLIDARSPTPNLPPIKTL